MKHFWFQTANLMNVNGNYFEFSLRLLNIDVTVHILIEFVVVNLKNCFAVGL